MMQVHVESITDARNSWKLWRCIELTKNMSTALPLARFIGDNVELAFSQQTSEKDNDDDKSDDTETIEEKKAHDKSVQELREALCTHKIISLPQVNY